jgi:hypothetical protein
LPRGQSARQTGGTKKQAEKDSKMKTSLFAALMLSAAVITPASAKTIVCPANTTCIDTPDTPTSPPAERPGYAAPPPVAPIPQAQPTYTLSMVCRKTWSGHDYVTVAADFDGNENVIHMRVLWSIEEGVFDRSTQYYNFKLWGSGNTAGWWGVHNTDSSETTRGDAVFVSGALRYQEIHFKNGVQVGKSQILDACTPTVYE